MHVHCLCFFKITLSQLHPKILQNQILKKILDLLKKSLEITKKIVDRWDGPEKIKTNQVKNLVEIQNIILLFEKIQNKTS